MSGPDTCPPPPPSLHPPPPLTVRPAEGGEDDDHGVERRGGGAGVIPPPPRLFPAPGEERVEGEEGPGIPGGEKSPLPPQHGSSFFRGEQLLVCVGGGRQLPLHSGARGVGGGLPLPPPPPRFSGFVPELCEAGTPAESRINLK